jgi:CDP-glucose 4,6-dehydratase
VDDVVEAYLGLARRSPDPDVRGEAFNFSCEHALTVLEITRKIQGLMDRLDLEPIILKQGQGEIRDQYLDSGKARRVLDWAPANDLESGLSVTIEWYKDFFSSTRSSTRQIGVEA